MRTLGLRSAPGLSGPVTAATLAHYLSDPCPCRAGKGGPGGLEADERSERRAIGGDVPPVSWPVVDGEW